MHGDPAVMVGDTAPALPPLNIHAKPASDAVRKARRELFMAKYYRTPWRIVSRPSALRYAFKSGAVSEIDVLSARGV